MKAQLRTESKQSRSDSAELVNDVDLPLQHLTFFSPVWVGFFIFFLFQQVVTKRRSYVLLPTAQDQERPRGRRVGHFLFRWLRLTETGLLKWMSQMCKEGWVVLKAWLGLPSGNWCHPRAPCHMALHRRRPGCWEESLSLWSLQSRKQTAQQEQGVLGWVEIMRKTLRDCYLINVHHCRLQLNPGPHDFNTFIQIARQENPSVAADAQV